MAQNLTRDRNTSPDLPLIDAQFEACLSLTPDLPPLEREAALKLLAAAAARLPLSIKASEKLIGLALSLDDKLARAQILAELAEWQAGRRGIPLFNALFSHLGAFEGESLALLAFGLQSFMPALQREDENKAREKFLALAGLVSRLPEAKRGSYIAYLLEQSQGFKHHDHVMADCVKDLVTQFERLPPLTLDADPFCRAACCMRESSHLSEFIRLLQQLDPEAKADVLLRSADLLAVASPEEAPSVFESLFQEAWQLRLPERLPVFKVLLKYSTTLAGGCFQQMRRVVEQTSEADFEGTAVFMCGRVHWLFSPQEIDTLLRLLLAGSSVLPDHQRARVMTAIVECHNADNNLDWALMFDIIGLTAGLEQKDAVALIRKVIAFRINYARRSPGPVLPRLTESVLNLRTPVRVRLLPDLFRLTAPPEEAVGSSGTMNTEQFDKLMERVVRLSGKRKARLLPKLPLVVCQAVPAAQLYLLSPILDASQALGHEPLYATLRAACLALRKKLTKHALFDEEDSKSADRDSHLLSYWRLLAARCASLDDQEYQADVLHRLAKIVSFLPRQGKENAREEIAAAANQLPAHPRRRVLRALPKTGG